MQVSHLVSSSKKNYNYFIDYKDHDHKIKPLRIVLPKMSAYVKSYDGETKWMYFFIKDELLEKYGIWNKVSNSSNKELDCESIYNKKFLITKIRSYGYQASYFHGNEIIK